MLATQFAPLPLIGELAARDARIAFSLRHWVIARKQGRCPIAGLAQRLGTAHAAAQMHILLEEVGCAWPEPFCVSPPCCPRLSHDEATLCRMLRYAHRADRAGFDAELRDLIPADTRQRLYASAEQFNAVVA